MKTLNGTLEETRAFSHIPPLLLEKLVLLERSHGPHFQDIRTPIYNQRAEMLSLKEHGT